MSGRIPDPADPFEEEGLPTGMDLASDRKRITGDEQEGIPTPSEQPIASEDYGTTGMEERAGESLERRVGREQPDASAQTPPDESAAADTPYPQDHDERSGRIVQPDEGVRTDTEKDEAARDVGTDSGGFTGEERAIRVDPER